jgi:hypothetical protein
MNYSSLALRRDTKVLRLLFAILFFLPPATGLAQIKKNIAPNGNTPAQPNLKIEGAKTAPGVVALEGTNRKNDPGRAPAKVDIKLSLTYQKFDLKTKLYELPSSMADRTGETFNTTNTSRILDGARELKEGMIEMPSESYRMIAITIENKTSEPVYFNVAQHSIAPADEALGIKFVCLCTSQVFRVKPNQTWVRIMKLQINSANRASNFNLVHTIYGIDPATLAKYGSIID